MRVQKTLLNTGTHPILQAVDVLAYARIRLNSVCQQALNGDCHFPLPEHVFLRSKTMSPSSLASAPSKRVLSLKDPSSKNSKSSPDPFSGILLTDTSSQFRKWSRNFVER
ncbi:hypothetical protein JVT61DRAFT_2678 [Boletus reticuloceps]|uniref:Uncharacterized protein n=1 Tax=Boletus reticuloceps TaxID=495285 RepID=A0A8I2YPP5_9AGAM|nr:hypothetical protein JVT61DRAFT_2678 [Boletus reticuloceps]